MLILWLSSYLAAMFYQLASVARYGDRISVPFFFLGSLPAVIAIHLLRHFSLEKSTLLDGLAQFDVRNAECRSEFDKEFIHAAIAEWYGTPEKFSEYVRGPLRRELIWNVHRSTAPVAYSLLVATAPIAAGLESLVGLWKGGAPMISIVTQLVGNVIALDIFWFLICVQISIALCDYFSSRGRGCLECLKTLLILIVFGMCISFGLALSGAACRLGLGYAFLFLGFTLLPICCLLCCAKRMIQLRAGVPTSEPAAASQDNEPDQA